MQADQTGHPATHSAVRTEVSEEPFLLRTYPSVAWLSSYYCLVLSPAAASCCPWFGQNSQGPDLRSSEWIPDPILQRPVHPYRQDFTAALFWNLDGALQNGRFTAGTRQFC